MNNEKIYNGSKICLITSQLFLIAGIYNIYHKNFLLGILIILLSIASSLYHYDGNKKAKQFDIFMIYFTGSVCILISLYNKNIIPLLILIIAGFLYKNNNNIFLQKLKDKSKIKTPNNETHLYDNIYHIFVHLTAFIGTLTLIYNTKKI